MTQVVPSSQDMLIAFAAELKRFAVWQPVDKSELERWYEEADELHRRFRLVTEGDERYWHFMSDADIRVRDAAYAARQKQTFLEFIADIERRAVSDLEQKR